MYFRAKSALLRKFYNKNEHVRCLGKKSSFSGRRRLVTRLLVGSSLLILAWRSCKIINVKCLDITKSCSVVVIVCLCAHKARCAIIDGDFLETFAIWCWIHYMWSVWAAFPVHFQANHAWCRLQSVYSNQATRVHSQTQLTGAIDMVNEPYRSYLLLLYLRALSVKRGLITTLQTHTPVNQFSAVGQFSTTMNGPYEYIDMISVCS